MRAPSPSRATFADTKPPVPPVPPVPAPAPAPAPESVTKPASAQKGDDDLPPRPKFATPPPEDDDDRKPISKGPVVISPATPDPERAQSPSSQKQLESPSDEGGKSPLAEDKPLTSLTSSLARTGSGETPRVRRPGGARGPRVVSGLATSTTTSSTSPGHARRGSGSIGGASPRTSMISPKADPSEYVPKKKGGKTSAGAFGRREDE